MSDLFENWEVSDTDDLFKEDTTSKPPVVQAALTDDTIEVETDDKGEEEEDFFKDDTNEGNPSGDTTTKTDEDEEEDEEDVEISSIKATFNFLKDSGYIEMEEGEELPEDEEELQDVIEEKFEEAINNRIKSKLTGLDARAQEALKFIISGGNIDDFVSVSDSVDLKRGLSLEEESEQASTLRALLRAEGEDDETIETQIAYLKENSKLEAFTKKKYSKWESEITAREKELASEAEEKRKENANVIREAKRSASEFLKANEKVGEITINKKDRDILPSYMNDRTVKLANGGEITEMQKELFYELPKNETAMMQLALLLKNRKDDGSFDFSSILKEATTKVVKNIKQNVTRQTTVKNKNTDRPLADYFD